ncbi:hypothetical protein ig2599ANME_1546 [groundwater metagenome]
MKYIVLLILLGALALPASASTVTSWQTDISGYNLTLNYTSIFSVAKNDTLGIIIKNVGVESINDTITVNKINVSDTTKATGSWTGSWVIEPNSSETIPFNLNIINDVADTINIKIYYNVSSDNKVLVVTAQYPGPGAPNITPWNNKTNNDATTLTVNTSEVVRFNFTANQTLTSWSWKLNGNTISTSSDTLTYTFNNHGSYRLNASGSNSNGSTQPIVWNINVLEKEGRKKNATLISWSPQVVDYVYVNDTVNETIEYYLTTAEPLTVYNWSVDGKPVTGDVDGDTYYFTQTWDNDSVGFHTVIFKGSNADTKVEFRWYVNVYEIGGYRGGSLFDIIDEALENHATDIKIRMFKYKIAKGNGKSDFAARKVNQLHDEIAKRQMTREALRAEFKAGNISIEDYVAALKLVQRDAKYNSKLAKGYANIAKDHKDDKSEKEFRNIAEMETKTDKKKEEANTKGKEEASTKGKSKGNNKDDKNKNNGRGKG